MVNVFAVPVFFICLRESLETSIIVSILLAFLKQTLDPDRDRETRKKLVHQIWWGVGLGLLICIAAGGGMIGAFYSLKKDKWSSMEDLWEGIFGLVASIIITVVGAAMLRVSKLQEKWRIKIANAVQKRDNTQATSFRSRFKVWCEKYTMFILPFITVVREGLEAVLFVGGVSLALPATAFPLPAILGFALGCLVGYLVYKGGNHARIQTFLTVSTCCLYLVAAGLFSKSVWFFETNKWNKTVGGDSAESGTGPGSYDIRQSVWHVNCCSPLINGGGGWGIFNAVFGWQNSATYGSVTAYNLYWVVVSISFVAMRYQEKTGHWPLMKAKETQSAEYKGSVSSEAVSIIECGKGLVGPEPEAGSIVSTTIVS